MASTVVFLAACGGGGEGGGTPTGPSATLRLYPPIAGVSLPVGASGSTGVEVRGGRGPYTITTSDASVSVGLSKDNMLLVSGNSDGSSDVVVYDSSLPVQQVKITVTAKAVAMASSVGPTLNMAVGETRTVNMRGGVPPYTASSSDNSVVTATMSGSTITLVGQAAGGAATVTVTDATGATFALSVTVTTVPVRALDVSPNAVGGVIGGTNTLVISGGKAPYSVGVSNTTVASASLSGATVSVSLLAVGTSTVKITDSAGASFPVTVTVTAPSAGAVPLTVSPKDQVVMDNNNVAIRYLITGGTAPYAVLLSPADLVMHNINMDNGADVPTLTMSVNGNRCIPAGSADRVIPIDIYDATLTKITATLTVKDAVPAAPCP